VLENGIPVPQAPHVALVISAQEGRGRAYAPVELQGREGAFEVAGLDPGTYVGQVWVGDESFFSTRFVLDEGGALDLELRFTAGRPSQVVPAIVSPR